MGPLMVAVVVGLVAGPGVGGDTLLAMVDSHYCWRCSPTGVCREGVQGEHQVREAARWTVRRAVDTGLLDNNTVGETPQY